MVRSLPRTFINPPSREVTAAPLSANPPLYFPHDWGQPFTVVTQWSTDIVSSFYSGLEETTGTTLRPVRSITASHKSNNKSVDFLRQYIMGLTPPNDPFPTNLTWQTYGRPKEVQVGLDCDRSKVIGVLNPVTAYGDWGQRRIYLGQRVFVELPNRGVITVGSKRLLGAACQVTYVDRTLLAVSGLPFPLEAGMIVTPIIDCSAVESTSVQDITGRVSEAEVEASEALGPSQLPPLFEFRQTLPNVPTFEGYPIHVVDHNWSASATQVTIRERSGTRAVALHGPSSRRGIQVEGLSIGRDTWYQALSYFDNAQGQAGRLWAVLPAIVAGPDNPATRISSTRYRIQESGSFDDWLSMYKALAFEDEDGTAVIARITGSPAPWEVTLSAPIPSTVGRCIRWAALCRFGDDGFEEEWVTSEVGNFRYSLYEATDPISTGMVEV